MNRKKRLLRVSCDLCQLEESRNSDTSKEYKNICVAHLQKLKDNCHIRLENVTCNIVKNYNEEAGHMRIPFNGENWLDIYKDGNVSGQNIMIGLCYHSLENNSNNNNGKQKKKSKKKTKKHEQKEEILKPNENNSADNDNLVASKACFYVITNNGVKNKIKCEKHKMKKESCYCIQADDGTWMQKTDNHGKNCDALLYHCRLCDIDEKYPFELKRRSYVCDSHRHDIENSTGLRLAKENTMFTIAKSNREVNCAYIKLGSFNLLQRNDEQKRLIYFKKRGSDVNFQCRSVQEWEACKEDIVFKKCTRHKDCFCIASGLPSGYIQMKGEFRHQSACNHGRTLIDIVETFEKNGNYKQQNDTIKRLKEIIQTGDSSKLDNFFSDNIMKDVQVAFDYFCMLLTDVLCVNQHFNFEDETIVRRNSHEEKTAPANNKKFKATKQKRAKDDAELISKLKVFLLCVGMKSKDIHELAAKIWIFCKKLQEVESKLVASRLENWGTGFLPFICDARKHRNAYNIMLKNKRIVSGVFRKKDKYHMFLFARTLAQPFGEFFKINETTINQMNEIVEKHWQLTRKIRKSPDGYANPENKKKEEYEQEMEALAAKFQALAVNYQELTNKTVSLEYKNGRCKVNYLDDDVMDIDDTDVDSRASSDETSSLHENNRFSPVGVGSNQYDRDSYNQDINSQSDANTESKVPTLYPVRNSDIDPPIGTLPQQDWVVVNNNHDTDDEEHSSPIKLDQNVMFPANDVLQELMINH